MEKETWLFIVEINKYWLKKHKTKTVIIQRLNYKDNH